MRDLLVPVLLVAALGQPVAGVVFVLDGVLIGAGDGRYLAWAGVVTLVVYAPVGARLAAVSSAGLVALWVVFAVVFMGARLRGAGAPGPRRRVAGDRRRRSRRSSPSCRAPSTSRARITVPKRRRPPLPRRTVP